MFCPPALHAWTIVRMPGRVVGIPAVALRAVSRNHELDRMVQAGVWSPSQASCTGTRHDSSRASLHYVFTGSHAAISCALQRIRLLDIVRSRGSEAP